MIGFLLLLLLGCKPELAQPKAPPAPTATLPLGVTVTTRAPATAVFEQITAIPLPTSTAAPTATPIYHTIAAGDTLLDIAIDNNITVTDITSLNPEVNPNLLTVGQQLLLPTPAGAAVLDAIDETAALADVQIEQVQLYPLPQGSGWLLGTLRNVGENEVEDVRLTLRLRDADGSVAWETAVWLPVPLLAANEAAPFGALVPELPADVQPEVILAGGREVVTAGSRLRSFVVENVTLAERQLSGDVQNMSEADAAQVTLVVALFDASDALVGFQQQVVAEQLGSGQKRPFALIIAPPGGTAVRAEPLIYGTVSEASN